MCKSIQIVITALLLSVAMQAGAQNSGSSEVQTLDLPGAWNGVWMGEGTLFAIAVQVEGDVMQISKIETLGFEWHNEDGKVDGNIVTVAVEYAGVTGVIQAELIDATTAVAFAATCIPEFMVVCVLAKNQQAVFRKSQ